MTIITRTNSTDLFLDLNIRSIIKIFVGYGHIQVEVSNIYVMANWIIWQYISWTRQNIYTLVLRSFILLQFDHTISSYIELWCIILMYDWSKTQDIKQIPAKSNKVHERIVINSLSGDINICSTIDVMIELFRYCKIDTKYKDLEISIWSRESSYPNMSMCQNKVTPR